MKESSAAAMGRENTKPLFEW